MDKEYRLGSIVVMKKPHPCGTNEWEIIRLGADIKIKCVNCSRVIMLPRVEFNKNASTVENDPDGQFANGLYDIYITNKSDHNLKLTVFLTDDDNNDGNSFLYAYRVIYTNATQTNEIITNNSYEFYKSVKEFTITNTGAAQ